MTVASTAVAGVILAATTAGALAATITPVSQSGSLRIFAYAWVPPNPVAHDGNSPDYSEVPFTAGDSYLLSDSRSATILSETASAYADIAIAHSASDAITISVTHGSAASTPRPPQSDGDPNTHHGAGSRFNFFDDYFFTVDAATPFELPVTFARSASPSNITTVTRALRLTRMDGNQSDLLYIDEPPQGTYFGRQFSAPQTTDYSALFTGFLPAGSYKLTTSAAGGVEVYGAHPGGSGGPTPSDAGSISAALTLKAPGIWRGGSGSWSNASDWIGAVLPDNGSIHVKIDGGKAGSSAVSLDQDATVACITVDAGDALTIGAGKTLTLVGPGTSLIRGTLSFDPGGKVDLRTNKLVVTGQPLSNVESLINNGRLISTSTVANAWTTLAVASNADLHKTEFGGVSVSDADVLAMFTYAGDADLNGMIDGDDFGHIDSGYSAHLTGYANGDFDHSGLIDADDYWLIDVNYSRNLPSLSSGAPVGTTPIPEPAAHLVVIGVAAVAMWRRKRSRYQD